jgi:2-oxoisovalerate dehydrogenase E1 component
MSWKYNIKALTIDSNSVVEDYRTIYLSRQVSLLARKEVLGGRAKFGIFGDGKELPQVVLAKFFKKGDWRSGYYRDQTLMFALGALTTKQFFAQLYADSSLEREPASAGRQMNCHFSSRYISGNKWLPQTKIYNSASDISPTAGQMVRSLGLAYASTLYKNKKDLKDRNFSNKGQEIVYATIGNASTSEGLFWETINAAGVLSSPLVVSIWDDGYGISVPTKLQTVKDSIFKALQGFKREDDCGGIELLQVKGNNYLDLVKIYQQAEEFARNHIPVVVHVTHLTQPQGHSTSGSHERYKSQERLSYEEEIDCLVQMREWIIKEKITDKDTLDKLEKEVLEIVEKEKLTSWQEYQQDIFAEKKEFVKAVSLEDSPPKVCEDVVKKLEAKKTLLLKDIHEAGFKIIRNTTSSWNKRDEFRKFFDKKQKLHKKKYTDFLYLPEDSFPAVAAQTSSSKRVDGRVIIRDFFKKVLKKYPRVCIFGEDVGHLGGVNLEFEGLQETYSSYHVTDTGIREATILGQGIGCAMRGLRPIVDIQYLDYLAYCLQGMSDDLATLSYRSAGGQSAPVIVRTKGHRLEGIWHTGSPLSMILGSVRGMYVCVPRNSTQAAGLYNTLLQSNNPSLVVEVLNSYRVKEKYPENLGDYHVSLGVPEILAKGDDITIVTYGANVAIALSCVEELQSLGVSVEVVDVQTLIPFDKNSLILKSLRKTNRIIFFDEDVPGGATAYMLQKVMEEQGGFYELDSPPRTLTAVDNRSAYGSDGDYFCKPNKDDLINLCCEVMQESDNTYKF